MDLIRLSQTLQQDAVTVVFLNVLLQQLGLPVPAVPTLLLAGSLAATPGQAGKILAAAIVASVMADWIWYHAGRRFGYRVRRLPCMTSSGRTLATGPKTSPSSRYAPARKTPVRFWPLVIC